MARGAQHGAVSASLSAQAATIEEQRLTIAELQLPILQVWPGILAVPIVGSLDTTRTQEMTEALLDTITATGAEMVLLDLTGVPLIDTAVAKHLLETVAAARLLGAEVIIVGLTMRLVMTLVHLGLDLGDVVTCATMAHGLARAFQRLGLRVVPLAGNG